MDAVTPLTLRGLAATLLLFGLLAALALLAGRALPDGGMIAFSSNRSGGYELYLLDVARHLTARLTNHVGYYCCPEWSPDGRWLAFSTSYDLNSGISILDFDSLRVHGLTGQDASTVYFAPTWSPDDREIAVMAHQGGGRYKIFIFARDSGSIRALTPADFYTEDYPAWSPDGRRIAFTSRRAGHSAIYVVDRDGRNEHRLTENSSLQAYPAWSPDGRYIAFTSLDNATYNIYTMDSGGGSIRLVAGMGWNLRTPAWSPDGRRIVFTADVNRNWEIYMVDVSCLESGQVCQPAPQPLVEGPAADGEPVWRP